MGNIICCPVLGYFTETDSFDLCDDMVDTNVLKMVVRTFLLELVRYRTSSLLPTKHTKDIPAV